MLFIGTVTLIPTPDSRLPTPEGGGRPMDVAGRKRWWRAAVIAVLGGGSILGGWAGLSRSAPPTPPASSFDRCGLGGCTSIRRAWR